MRHWLRASVRAHAYPGGGRSPGDAAAPARTARRGDEAGPMGRREAAGSTAAASRGAAVRDGPMREVSGDSYCVALAVVVVVIVLPNVTHIWPGEPFVRAPHLRVPFPGRTGGCVSVLISLPSPRHRSACVYTENVVRALPSPAAVQPYDGGNR